MVNSQQATGLHLPPALKMRPLPALFLLSYISLARAGTLAGDGARFWPGFPGWPWGGAGGGAGAGDEAEAGTDDGLAGGWGGCPSLGEVDIYRWVQCTIYAVHFSFSSLNEDLIYQLIFF